MDYYHSQSIQSPTVKKLPLTNSIVGSHASNESGKSTSSTKKISSDIHLFLAEQDEEDFAIRKPSSFTVLPSPKKEAKPINKAASMTTLPESKNATSPKRDIPNRKSNGSYKANPTKYAGGGYEKSPNPKQLSKPNLTSPAKKEKKTSEPNSPPKSQIESPNKFVHSIHSHSSPNLIGSQVPYPQMVGIPLSVSPVNNFNFGGQSYYLDSNFSAMTNPSMTREEANQDLRRRLNII